ncbi:unnamed protein product [Wickerhamomyces anomalus]
MSAELFSLKGKVVVITGATRGIGEGMALGLAEAGAHLIIVHRGSTDPSEAVEKLQALGAQVGTVVAELSSNEEVETILPQALKISPTGSVDVLVNNAGMSYYRKGAEDTEDIAWDTVLQVNITSVFRLSRAFGKYWISEGKKGKIINTASLYSFIGGQNVIPYTASKGALHSLTQGLSNEWSKKGINVNSIVPGYIITDMTSDLVKDKEKYVDLLKRIPAGRWGDPADFKGPIVFLASAASDYVTGDSIFVDGGFIAN